MSNIRYAVLIIGALSLLLGLSLGQIYHQHQRIEQLEFNRFRQSGKKFDLRRSTVDLFRDQCRKKHRHHGVEERARAEAEARVERELRIEADRAERKLQEAIRRYNKELQLWESTKWRSTSNGLYRVED